MYKFIAALSVIIRTFYLPNLVATGVLMEAYSVEDNGQGLCFNVFCYNA